MNPLDALLCGVVAGVAAVERRALAQAMLSQPLVLGLLFGFYFGHPAAGVLAGAALSLLWAAAVAVGATLPPHEALAAAVILPATLHQIDLGAPPALALGLAFVVASPLVFTGAWLERRLERAGDAAVTMVRDALLRGEPVDPFVYNLRPAALLFASAAALAGLVAYPLVIGGVTLLSGGSDHFLRGVTWFGALLPFIGAALAMRALQRANMAMTVLGGAAGAAFVTVGGRVAGWW